MELSWVWLGGVHSLLTGGHSPIAGYSTSEGFVTALTWCMWLGLKLRLCNYWARVGLKDGWPSPYDGGKPCPRKAQSTSLCLWRKRHTFPHGLKGLVLLRVTHLTYIHSLMPIKYQAQRLQIRLLLSRAREGKKYLLETSCFKHFC